MKIGIIIASVREGRKGAKVAEWVHSSAQERDVDYTLIDLAEFAKVDPADQPHVLARHIYELTHRALEGRADPDGRLQLLDDLVALLEVPLAAVDTPARQLQRLARPSGPGVVDIEPVRPKPPLSEAALLTNLACERCPVRQTGSRPDP